MATGNPVASLGPVTDAGRFLAAFSPLQQSLRQENEIARQPAASTEGAGRTAQDWLNLAVQYQAAGRMSDAIAALQSAASLAPQNAIAHYNLGLAFLKAGRATEAVASLRQAISLQADYGRAHLHLGSALQDLGYDEDALVALRTAIALRTNVKEAHARLGDLLRARGDATGAAENYRKAVDGSAQGRLYLAKALMAEEKFAEAEAAARRALALDPNSGETEWVLANVLLMLGRFDEVVAHCDRAIALVPTAVGAYATRVMARQLDDSDRQVVARMANLLESGGLGDVARMKMEYALGKAYDDLGDHAAAIQHFDGANRINRRLSSYDRAGQAAWVDTIVARCTREYFTRNAALGVDDKSPIFVVGMPRSGTTLVEQIVSSHPQVAGGGELEFWLQRGPAWEREGSEALSAGPIRRLADDYRTELHRISPSAARITDKMPQNFLWLGLIHLVFPNARFIHCRRNPIDTCLSNYFTHFLRRMDFANDRGDLVWEYRQYERLMAHWRSVLPIDRFLDVDYESLVSEKESGTRRLIAFCGLDWDEACLRPEDNQRIVRTASVWQARQPVYRSSVERWRNYEPWLGELRELLSAEAAS